MYYDLLSSKSYLKVEKRNYNFNMQVECYIIYYAFIYIL